MLMAKCIKYDRNNNGGLIKIEISSEINKDQAEDIRGFLDEETYLERYHYDYLREKKELMPSHLDEFDLYGWWMILNEDGLALFDEYADIYHLEGEVFYDVSRIEKMNDQEISEIIQRYFKG